MHKDAVLSVKAGIRGRRSNRTLKTFMVQTNQRFLAQGVYSFVAASLLGRKSRVMDKRQSNGSERKLHLSSGMEELELCVCLDQVLTLLLACQHVREGGS